MGNGYADFRHYFDIGDKLKKEAFCKVSFFCFKPTGR